MATCAECVHVEACHEFVKGLAAARGLKLGSVEEISAILQSDDCEQFKDRARFVELPRVGDKVYELCRINQFGDYKIVESEIKGFIVDTDGTAFDYELLGKRFFLTPEEALKERDFNGQSQN